MKRFREREREGKRGDQELHVGKERKQAIGLVSLLVMRFNACEKLKKVLGLLFWGFRGWFGEVVLI